MTVMIPTITSVAILVVQARSWLPASCSPSARSRWGLCKHRTRHSVISMTPTKHAERFLAVEAHFRGKFYNTETSSFDGRVRKDASGVSL